MRIFNPLLFVGLALCLAGNSAIAQSVNGTIDAAYGAPLSVQNTQTGFGKSVNGALDNANGSELDAGYGVIKGGVLYVGLAGNLESNFNKLDLFFQTGVGGQNVLRNDNANVDFNGLNRMAGLTFKSGFAPNYYLGVTNGGSPVTVYSNYAELNAAGSGNGYYLGSATPGSGAVSGGTNPYNIQIGLNNSNTAGVGAGMGTDPGNGVSVHTGLTLGIPLAALGNPTGPISVFGFVNGSGHDFLSNQVLGGIGGGDNIGEPSNANFNNYGAFANPFVVPAAVPEPSALTLALSGGIALLGLRRRKARRSA